MVRGSPVRRRVEDAVRFVRLFSAGVTLLYPLAGIATARGSWGPGAVARALLAGLLFHVYADVGNDVADLAIDRTDPRRRPDPLVRGAVRPQHALLLTVATLPLLVAVGGPATGWLAAGAALLAAYNVAGKAVPVPFVADVVQGAGWACLVYAGAALAGGPGGATPWVAAFVVAYVAMVNGVHGAIRDAQNDRRAGARTTALALGVRVEDGAIALPVAVRAYGLLVHAALGLLLAGVVTRRSAVPAAVLYGAATVALLRADRARHDLRRAMAYGTWHLFLVPAALLAAVAARQPAWAVAVTAVAYLAPPWLFGRAVRGSEFGLPASTAAATPRTRRGAVRALVEMTRPGTPAVGAAFVAVGAWLGGAPRWAGVLPAMAATALVVAAANVYNDRCDRVADEVNRPDRPIPAGVVTPEDSDRFVLAASAGAVAAAAPLGRAGCVLLGGLLVVGLAYSLVLRRVLLAGPLVVALLFAAPLVYGGWVAGAVRTENHVAAALATLYVFARETLKCVPDRAGDRAAGYRTVATEFGERAALRVFRSAAVAFCVAAVAAFAVVHDPGYLAAVVACAVVPTAQTIRLVRGAPSTDVVTRAVAFSGRVFGVGLLPLLLLR